MSLMLRNFEYLAGGTANGQYPSADLEANIAAATTGAALRTALGIGSYVDDTAAGVAGVATGELYYNTTDTAYVLKS